MGVQGKGKMEEDGMEWEERTGTERKVEGRMELGVDES